ncbi:TPA: hypothetical protein HH702_004518 [Escherichia coli]|uniref:Mobile element protein n=1 Tax=Escherichia coli TaxID=562 RepID=A0A2S1JE38_ECOLX|nr:hypothetical protein [Escherichia coli]AWF76583.1 Mobile element protein [Escherichia coli]QIQ17332.1 DNA replication protein [Escherichia coli]QIQ17994.1 DNA replication protein [Escherichia coli]QIQ18194.1 DNA replication protein [Escherichia coli]UNB12419.1 DNA replication protein [Escherichia coli]
MGSCAAPSAKGDDKFITTDYLQQCPYRCVLIFASDIAAARAQQKARHRCRAPAPSLGP